MPRGKKILTLSACGAHEKAEAASEAEDAMILISCTSDFLEDPIDPVVEEMALPYEMRTVLVQGKGVLDALQYLRRIVNPVDVVPDFWTWRTVGNDPFGSGGHEPEKPVRSHASLRLSWGSEGELHLGDAWKKSP